MIEDEEFVSVDNFLPFLIVIIASISILYFIYRSEKSLQDYTSEIYDQLLYIRGKLWLWMNMDGDAIKIVK